MLVCLDAQLGKNAEIRWYFGYEAIKPLNEHVRNKSQLTPWAYISWIDLGNHSRSFASSSIRRLSVNELPGAIRTHAIQQPSIAHWYDLQSVSLFTCHFVIGETLTVSASSTKWPVQIKCPTLGSLSAILRDAKDIWHYFDCGQPSVVPHEHPPDGTIVE